MSDPGILYGPWRGAGQRLYRVVAGGLPNEPEVEIRRLDSGEWCAAKYSGAAAAALELQRLAGERDALRAFTEKAADWFTGWVSPYRYDPPAAPTSPVGGAQALLRELEALAKGGEREAAPSRAEAEVARLTAWLQKIDGGDSPCTDESQLRQWAYEALTLGREASDG